MVPKVEVIQHMYDVVCLVLVFEPQVVQNSHFHQRLVMEPFLITDNLYGHLQDK